jgi:hypothetical protein
MAPQKIAGPKPIIEIWTPSERIAVPQMSEIVDRGKSKAWRQIHKNMQDKP